jgi:hypothetical protein
MKFIKNMIFLFCLTQSLVFAQDEVKFFKLVKLETVDGEIITESKIKDYSTTQLDNGKVQIEDVLLVDNRLIVQNEIQSVELRPIVQHFRPVQIDPNEFQSPRDILEEIRNSNSGTIRLEHPGSDFSYLNGNGTGGG